MTEKANRISIWEEKWKKGTTAWHLQDVNPHVVNFAEKFLTGPNRRVFVPLCGKTVDMKWLYDKGHTVIGVEGVELAVSQFAAEQKLEMKREEISCGVCYKTADDRLVIYVCDLFALTPEIVGKVDAVWDRASLIAINECDREQYAKLMQSLLHPQFKILLASFEYVPTLEFSGPPKNVPGDLIQKLYGFEQQELQREDAAAFIAKNRLVIDKMDEVVWLLSDKQ